VALPAPVMPVTLAYCVILNFLLIFVNPCHAVMDRASKKEMDLAVFVIRVILGILAI
jgi:hypothetical protein